MKIQHISLFLLVLISAACSTPDKGVVPEFDQAKFEPLYRAGKSIQAATSIGTNYQRMGELLQNFATEVLIAKDKTKSDKERLLVARYEEAQQIYQDSLTLWKVQIDSSQYEWLKGYLYCSGEVAVIADRYKLQKEEKDLAGVGKKLSMIHSTSIQVLWQQSELKLQEGNKIYNSEINKK